MAGSMAHLGDLQSGGLRLPRAQRLRCVERGLLARRPWRRVRVTAVAAQDRALSSNYATTSSGGMSGMDLSVGSSLRAQELLELERGVCNPFSKYSPPAVRVMGIYRALILKALCVSTFTRWKYNV